MRRKRSLSNHHCLLQSVSRRTIIICASTVEGRTISLRSYPGLAKYLVEKSSLVDFGFHLIKTPWGREIFSGALRMR